MKAEGERDVENKGQDEEIRRRYLKIKPRISADDCEEVRDDM